MKIRPYIEKLGSSKEYQEFIKKHDGSFMMAGFFIIDLETGNNVHQIDYYVPKEKKIAAFTLNHGVTMQMLNMMNNRIVPEKMDMNVKIDLDALEGILRDEMKNRNMTEELKKIIAIVQNVNGKKVWNLNCVLSGMGILKAHIEDESQTVLKMEKSSIMDYLKRLPAGAMGGLKSIGGNNGNNGGGNQMMQGEDESGDESGEEQEVVSKGPGSLKQEKSLKEKIENLNKLEQEIEAEKKRYEQEIEKKKKKEKAAQN